MDTRGYLTIEGRLKDTIIRAGENIYSREIEDRLFSHPDVAEVAVAGIPDPAWGEAVAAFVRLSAGSAVSVEELRAYCAETLAPCKTPQQSYGCEIRRPGGRIQKGSLGRCVRWLLTIRTSATTPCGFIATITRSLTRPTP